MRSVHLILRELPPETGALTGWGAYVTRRGENP